MGRPKRDEGTVKVTFWLPKELKHQVDALKLERRGKTSINRILTAAVHSFVSPDEAEKREMVFARRMDRIDRKLASTDRKLEVLAETLALYIKTYLATSYEIPEEQKKAALAQGKRRWRKFIETLANQLDSGRTVFTEMPLTVFKAEDFAVMPESGTGKTTAEENNEIPEENANNAH